MSDEKNGKPRDFRDLLVWQKAMRLAKETYTLTAKFPSEEKFGLVSQMRRAAVSIVSNIAEGQARNSTPEFIQFISHAEGSACELHTQLMLSVELGHCPPEQADSPIGVLMEVRKMLNALRRTLVTRHSSLVTSPRKR